MNDEKRGGESVPEKMNNGKKDPKRLAITIVLILAVAGLLCAVVLIILQESERKREEAIQAAITADAYSTVAPVATASPAPATPEPVPTPTPVPHWYDAYARTPDRVINFAALKAKNPDIYAWINIPGTDIDYPMVHTFKFDETYLNYDAYLQENKMGAIFTDGWNAGDLSDRVTFIFGHNMKSGTMFAGLHRFRDAVFFDQYDTIKLYMDEVELDYRVFAVYKTTNEHILINHDFTDDAVYSEYLEEIFVNRDLSSNFRQLDLTVDNRILTLCTCVKDEPDNRLFVQAVLLPNE